MRRRSIEKKLKRKKKKGCLAERPVDTQVNLWVLTVCVPSGRREKSLESKRETNS